MLAHRPIDRSHHLIADSKPFASAAAEASTEGHERSLYRPATVSIALSSLNPGEPGPLGRSQPPPAHPFPVRRCQRASAFPMRLGAAVKRGGPTLRSRGRRAYRRARYAVSNRKISGRQSMKWVGFCGLSRPSIAGRDVGDLPEMTTKS